MRKSRARYGIAWLGLVALTACADDEAASGGDGTETEGSSTGDTTTLSGSASNTATMSGSASMSATGGTVDDSGSSDATATGSDSSGDGSSDTSADSSGDGSSSTGVQGECSDASECDGIYGAAPCGAWECNAGNCDVVCANCTDADLDGYGMGVGCAGGDCDDADDGVGATSMASCYSGPMGTDGVGTCTAGQTSCTDGVWAPCQGEVIPGGEACNLEDDDCNGMADDGLGQIGCGIGACANSIAACTNGQPGTCLPLAPAGQDGNAMGTNCNGVDDDCDGAIDEGCVGQCVWVTPAGSVNPDGSLMAPYGNIQNAIDAAQPGQFVCVAAGPNCGSTFTYNQTVSMVDGVSVYGTYETTTQTRCNNFNTRIATGTSEGVQFPDTVSVATVIDGFEIIRFNAQTSAGITIDGATSVTVSSIRIMENTGGAVQNSYGINMVNGAEATITRSLVYGGNGANESIGVRSIGSTPTIVDNCPDYDASGRCDTDCGWVNSFSNSIRGRYTPTGGLAVWAVLLEDSPGAVVDRSALCGHNTSGDGANIRITGDATGTLVRANLLNGWGGQVNSHGVWAEDCGGAAPWIFDNFRISGEGNNAQAEVDGVRAIGDCHPVIDSNVEIRGGSEGGAARPNGVYCGANGSGASQCNVLGNTLIRGAAFGFPLEGTGVRCDDDACNRIAGNVITGGGGIDVYGVWLQDSGTVVENNVISGGCATMTARGVYADDSFARLHNNRISAGTCPGSIALANYGIHVLVGDGPNELDVHSNVIDGMGNAGACDGVGLLVDLAVGAQPASGYGVFRNNIIRAGACQTSANVVVEVDALADPRVFENNLLDPALADALYVDADTMMPIGTAAGVDMLADITVAGTLSSDPMFVSYPNDLHIQGGSPCDGTGTPTGAPPVDIDGDARDPATPDIGVDEI